MQCFIAIPHRNVARSGVLDDVTARNKADLEGPHAVRQNLYPDSLYRGSGSRRQIRLKSRIALELLARLTPVPPPVTRQRLRFHFQEELGAGRPT
jgi:hypothetical protein